MKKSNKLLPGQKYALTLKEATEYFSVGEKAMRRLAEKEDLHLAIYSGNRWLFIRERVEEYFTRFLYEENRNFKLNIYPDEYEQGSTGRGDFLSTIFGTSYFV